MKVNNCQKSDEADNGISRETLNDWQRKDAAKKADEAKRRDSDSKEARNSKAPPHCGGSLLPSATSDGRQAWRDGLHNGPEVFPLPPHITFQRARNLSIALAKGVPGEAGVIRGVARQVLETVLPGKRMTLRVLDERLAAGHGERGAGCEARCWISQHHVRFNRGATRCRCRTRYKVPPPCRANSRLIESFL
jgi:hypothetical protein